MICNFLDVALERQRHLHYNYLQAEIAPEFMVEASVFFHNSETGLKAL